MAETHRPSILRRALAALAMLAITLGVLEGAVRAIGTVDADRQFYFAGVPLKPWQPFAKELAKQVEELDEAGASYLMPDARLGWTIAPSSTTRDGRYSANSIGVRGTREFAVQKPPDTLRVALFGASYVFGDEVAIEESFGHQLEVAMTRDGGADAGAVEVMNFGVGAYGHDQAYLRWKLDAQPFGPDVVVLGYQPGNCRRNVNVVRKFKRRRTRVPYSKPRFVLDEAAGGGDLRLINSPAVGPAALPALVRDFASSPLAAHEHFFAPADYADTWWRHSRLLATVEMLVDRAAGAPPDRLYSDPSRPEGKLCAAIIERFAAEVAATSRFVLVAQPTKPLLEARQGASWADIDPLWERLRARFEAVDTSGVLLEAAAADGIDSLFMPHGHYVGAANRLVAETLAAYLLAPQPGRN